MILKFIDIKPQIFMTACSCSWREKKKENRILALVFYVQQQTLGTLRHIAKYIQTYHSEDYAEIKYKYIPVISKCKTK